ncbi:PTS sugar transporter subunit IIB [Crassaminicella profunda]|uniref:PTS sugar transporter subunit IIB n=1 Tax=Crassaminicella profunda TaxID=1286698 RepID=UPI001CA6EA4B|nr:PTS sugar transporter subunit IIB [Crassaminicella profunda]QZY55799.1 PTS sugar transporter subunit IIB [Crassaminicella profunda]
MKKIFLFCSQGMSTSLLAKKMQDVAEKHKLPIEVKAFSHGEIEGIVEKLNPDCILLGPQVKYLYDETVKKLKDCNIPIAVIDSLDYGMMDAEKVLKKAIVLMKKNKK